MAGSKITPLFPKIDFSGLDLSNPGSNGWDSVRTQVMDALSSHNSFEAVFDRFGLRQRDELFGRRMEELFSVPLEKKMLTVNEKQHESYAIRDGYEILHINDPASAEAVQAFTSLMWPQGNPGFIKTIEEISEPLAELELMIRKMLFESLGISKDYDSHVQTTLQNLRLARYGPPQDQESMIKLPAHTDMNLISILYQHDGEGLEILTPEGQWFHAPPGSAIIFVAETLTALTNGRLKSTIHRVKMTSNDTRYSLGFNSYIQDGITIEAPQELVDEEHPKRYKPIEYGAYVEYRLANYVGKPTDALEDYCGIGVGTVIAS